MLISVDKKKTNKASRQNSNLNQYLFEALEIIWKTNKSEDHPEI